jgi:hypothetical protein
VQRAVEAAASPQEASEVAVPSGGKPEMKAEVASLPTSSEQSAAEAMPLWERTLGVTKPEPLQPSSPKPTESSIAPLADTPLVQRVIDVTASPQEPFEGIAASAEDILTSDQTQAEVSSKRQVKVEMPLGQPPQPLRPSQESVAKTTSSPPASTIKPSGEPNSKLKVQRHAISQESQTKVSAQLDLPESELPKVAVPKSPADTSAVSKPITSSGRQIETEMPLQKRPAPSSPTQPSAIVAEPDNSGVDLGQELLARASSVSRMPVIETLPLPRTPMANPPVQMAVLPQSRPVVQRDQVGPESESGERESLDVRQAKTLNVPELPLAASKQSERGRERLERAVSSSQAGSTTSAGLVQRQVVDSPPLVAPPTIAAPPFAAPVIQRDPAPAEGQPAPTEGEEAAQESAVDLDKLARQVYPLLKRMLAVERDRRSTR